VVPLYLAPDEVLATAERGAAMGCKEAPFTLGGRPEDRWPPKTRTLLTLPARLAPPARPNTCLSSLPGPSHQFAQRSIRRMTGEPLAP
jgi:2-iminoacetate synthase ThiH